MNSDNVLYMLLNGKWVATERNASNPTKANFVIVCNYGDWSGFRPLQECLDQIPERWGNYQPGFYQIVER